MAKAALFLLSDAHFTLSCAKKNFHTQVLILVYS